MEKDGLIGREPNPDDAHSTLVCLLPAGRAAIEKAASRHVEYVRRNFIDLLTPGSRNTALQEFVSEIPAPLVAEMLSYSDKVTQKVEEKMKPERLEYDAHVAELMVYGEEVFLTPDWIRQPGGEPPHAWNGARWRRRSLAEIRQRRWALGHRSFRGITVDSKAVAEVGEDSWTPILLRVP
jgi:DNA-binding MarR family transcriptional regulator